MTCKRIAQPLAIAITPMLADTTIKPTRTRLQIFIDITAVMAIVEDTVITHPGTATEITQLNMYPVVLRNTKHVVTFLVGAMIQHTLEVANLGST